MTLGEAKKRVLKLMDEYSSGGAVTEDSDIDLKMHAFFDVAQRHLATIKRIQRNYEIPLRAAENGEPYVEYSMPSDFYALCRMWAGNEVVSIGRWRGKALLLPAGERRKMIAEYFAYPQAITAETKDDYEFELAPEAQDCMPYWVAAQQLVVDLVVDYKGLFALYQQMVAGLVTEVTGPRAIVRRLGGGRDSHDSIF